MTGGALAGIKVVDFSTLLPGPMCSLLLAEAGAEVIKVERPASGDEMRSYLPKFGEESVNFALLNRGKRSVALDLKNPGQLEQAIELIRHADVLIEQFRPGVMDRLGLGFEAMHAVNPGLVYCSITGWGQNGPLADIAAHDLNYQAESGMLGLTAGSDGAPGLPPALLADLGGGAYPAMLNILLALRVRDQGGLGSHIDVAMAENLFTFLYWGLGSGFSAGQWPEPGGDLVTGGTPRYQIYRTKDARYLAAAPLEQKFWVNFLDVIAAPHLVDDRSDPAHTRAAVAQIVASKTADEWMQRFAGIDACVSVVRTLREAVEHPHFKARDVFGETLQNATGEAIPALPVPISPAFRCASSKRAPALGEAGAVSFRN